MPKRIAPVFRSIFFLTLSLTSPLFATESSEEAIYAEAVVQFQRGEAKRALKILDRAISDAASREVEPSQQVLELEALLYKTLQKADIALTKYEKLLELAKAAKASEKDLAILEFEIAVCLVQLQRGPEAEKHFEIASKANYNPDSVQFFLGVIAFGKKEFDVATSRFEAVLKSELDPLKPSANFYLGRIAQMRRSFREARRFWQSARTTAIAVMQSPNVDLETKTAAQQVKSSAEAAILGVSGWTGTLGTLSGYDSNVLLFPNISAGSSGTSTFLQTLRLGLVYQSPSSGRFGFSYFGSGNLNFNADAKDGQFFVNSAGLSYRTLEGEFDALSLRADTLYVMRYSTDAGGFRSQSLASALGALWEMEPTTSYRYGAGVTFQPQVFFTDTSVDDFAKKSGSEIRLRGFYSSESKSRWWNPGYEASFFLMNTSGAEFRGRGLDIQFYDRIPINRRFSARGILGAGVALYPDRPAGSRTDIPLQFSGELTWMLTRSWRLSGLLSYQYNYSNITDIYAFNRAAASVALDTKF